MVLGGIAVAGFFAAVIVHSMVRADTFAAGLAGTLGWDALKKYSVFGQLAGSISAESVIPLSVVLEKYTLDWPVAVLVGMPGKSVFAILICLALLSLAFQFYVRIASAKENAALLLFSLLAPLSWLILMQNHSAIHLHLNYVLWCFGFLPALLATIVNGGSVIIQALREMGYKNHGERSNILKVGVV